MTQDLTPEMMLQAYAAGIFPMAERRDDEEVFWVDPHDRGVMPLDGFHASRSLLRSLRRSGFTCTVDTSFADVVEGCADRDETWINTTLQHLYLGLFRRGRAHSIEIWDGRELVGGIFGVTLGAAFFGESMFSRRTDASKIAMVYLVDRLRHSGFRLFDTQFLTPHLASLGAIEVPRAAYHILLNEALADTADFEGAGPPPGLDQLLQRMTQTS